MYFSSRADAGRQLADKLKHFDKELCAVVALTPGSVIIGAQIAMRIHSSLMILLSEKLYLPGEKDALAAMTGNTFTYNSKFSIGELEELKGEYRGIIEQQQREKQHKLNMLLADGAEIDPLTLRNHNIIIVSDGLQSAATLDVASDYLKPIKAKKLIVATPFASVQAVDKMHLVGDEIYCLNVAENFLDINHYYEDNTIPNQQGLLKIIHNIALNWS